MTYEIHFRHTDGTADMFVVTGEHLSDVRKKAEAGLAQRGGTMTWSVVTFEEV